MTTVDPASFPPEFQFGVATSAYQIEGAWDADGKGPSIWDTFSQTPGKVHGDIAGDVACDSYHRYRDDIRLMSQLGVDSHRLSLSWPRLLPDGTGRVNPAGVDYYDRVIDELLEAGIRPNVTLYHWDLPQALEDRGGWPNRDVADWFAEYAHLAFDRFGDRVQRWATLNEPIALWVGYALGGFAPGRRDERAGRQAMHNALLAHGRGVQAFRDAGSPGEIGIVLDVWKRHPATPSAADRALADEGDDDGFRFFLDALRGGGYSWRIRERLTSAGTLPDIRDGDQELIEQPIDYLGLNVYSRIVVDSRAGDATASPASEPDQERHHGGNFLDNGLEFYPRSVYDALEMVREDYGWTGPVFITENGMADGPRADRDPLDDTERIDYVSGFLSWIARAIADGHDVRGYYLWSLMDNYEWSAGFSARYGIAAVDPVTLDRIPKKSAHWYRDLIAAHRAAHAGR
ncbi:GH1 family beta-glucosidase [Schumannella luteola]|uniref:Beta-glucosidase n=1 Tax=Schumannella luteola TaxID=472059 RepID=A0A852YF95_9MICO|nr:GH1 family beta-glucosidase [Schumannella luteola]NYG98407.1 beta-glucosidase [Schumannella luteola]TPX01355.1 beta-glucosidase [Schumannella luteola]